MFYDNYIENGYACLPFGNFCSGNWSRKYYIW